jgi:hypothetical protein
MGRKRDAIGDGAHPVCTALALPLACTLVPCIYPQRDKEGSVDIIRINYIMIIMNSRD